MVCSCCVTRCTNSVRTNKKLSPNKTSISFYRFPRVRIRFSPKYQKLIHEQRLAWLAALRRGELSEHKLDALRICSRHFSSGAPSDFRDTENPDWVPHLNMGYQASDDEHESEKYESYKYELLNYVETQLQFSQDPQTDNESHASEETISVGMPEVDQTDASVQTDLTSQYIAALEAELLKRNEEIYELRKHLSDALWTEESFQRDEKKTSYFSGLPSFKHVKHILEQLEPSLSQIRIQKLDNFQKLMLTLMKLRFNTSFKDLAYRFRIQAKYAGECFKKVLVLLVRTFQGLLHDGSGGRASDELPDVDMSNRGCGKSVNMHNAELIIREFLYNNTEQAAENVEKTRKVSASIRVEKIVRVMKNKYKILKGPVSSDFLKFKYDGKPILDYVVRSACILTIVGDFILPTDEPHEGIENVNVSDQSLLTDSSL